MKKSLKSILLASVAAGSLALSGCVTTTDTYFPTPVPIYQSPMYTPPPFVVVPGPYIHSNPHHWRGHHHR